MPDYKAMYFRMAHETAKAIDILIEVQRECEEMYINAEEPELTVLSFPENEPPDGGGSDSVSIENDG